MTAHVEVLRREVNLTSLGEAAHAAIARQKRSMVRGVIGFGLLIGLCVVLYVQYGDARLVEHAFSLCGIVIYVLVADLWRLEATRRWAEEPPPLDAAAARTARRAARLKLTLAVAAVVVPFLVEIPVGRLLNTAGLVASLHFGFVSWALSREIKGLRD